MKVGSKWRVWLPPELGYGDAGSPPAIEPNEVLVFEIELLAIRPRGECPRGKHLASRRRAASRRCGAMEVDVLPTAVDLLPDAGLFAGLRHRSPRVVECLGEPHRGDDGHRLGEQAHHG